MDAPSPAAVAGAPGHWTDLNQDAIVLGLLLECADDFVSGAVLCDKLDVPRAELLKRLDSLRARGYVIQTRGGLGYRLVEVPDQLGEAQIEPLLANGELGRRSITSTSWSPPTTRRTAWRIKARSTARWSPPNRRPAGAGGAGASGLHPRARA